METRAALLVFRLELEISAVAVQEIHQNSENAACSEDIFFRLHFLLLLLQRNGF